MTPITTSHRRRLIDLEKNVLALSPATPVMTRMSVVRDSGDEEDVCGAICFDR
jgi:hypothetical protein